MGENINENKEGIKDNLFEKYLNNPGDHMSARNYIIETTWKESDKRAIISVHAYSEDDAIESIKDKYTVPVTSIMPVEYRRPTERQVRYAFDLWGEIPEGCCLEDVSALIGNRQDHPAPKTLQDIAMKNKLCFSLLMDEPTLLEMIFYHLETNEKNVEKSALLISMIERQETGNWNVDHFTKYCKDSEELISNSSYLNSIKRFHADNRYNNLSEEWLSKGTIAYKTIKKYLVDEGIINKYTYIPNKALSNKPISVPEYKFQKSQSVRQMKKQMNQQNDGCAIIVAAVIFIIIMFVVFYFLSLL